jgi:hypothetical protein
LFFLLTGTISLFGQDTFEKIYIEQTERNQGFIIPPIAYFGVTKADYIIYQGFEQIRPETLLELTGFKEEAQLFRSSNSLQPLLIGVGALLFLGGGGVGGWMIAEDELAIGIPLAAVSGAGLGMLIAGIVRKPAHLPYEEALRLAEMYNTNIQY